MTRNEILRIAGDAGVDPGAVARFLAGKPVRYATSVLVTASAKRLGIDLPQTPPAAAGAPAGAPAGRRPADAA